MSTMAVAGYAATLEVALGWASHPDPETAITRAASQVATRLGGSLADLVLAVTAGAAAPAAVPLVRDALGPVDVAGGAASILLTDHGPVEHGALVVGVANAEGAASGVAATSGHDLADAAQAAARLVLAGWPFRARYPRGLGLAFARRGAGSASRFLESWRGFMGPKMRTACSVLSPDAVYGASGAPLLSVACIEAPYATGIGASDGTGVDGAPAAVDALVEGAAEATLTAVKRLEGRPARLVLVLESESRHRALGVRAHEHWAAIRSQMDEITPCVGWLSEQVAAYGRGVQPSDAPNALIVIALGDSPARP